MDYLFLRQPDPKLYCRPKAQIWWAKYWAKSNLVQVVLLGFLVEPKFNMEISNPLTCQIKIFLNLKLYFINTLILKQTNMREIMQKN